MKSRHNVLPNFLIIGAARTGTTTLYSLLRQHPQIFLPQSKRPEPHFFYKESEYVKGLDYYERKFFSRWDGQTAVGEASTSYLFGNIVPARVDQHIPDAKFIIMLRNPIERAHSSYWHTVKAGLEDATFEQAIANEKERSEAIIGTPLAEVAPYAYAARGTYFQQLTNWLQFFDQSRFEIILLEDFSADPRKTLDNVFAFLGVDTDVRLQNTDRIENRSQPEHATIPPATKSYMQHYFSDDVRSLGKLLGRDLSHWLA